LVAPGLVRIHQSESELAYRDCAMTIIPISGMPVTANPAMEDRREQNTNVFFWRVWSVVDYQASCGSAHLTPCGYATHISMAEWIVLLPRKSRLRFDSI